MLRVSWNRWSQRDSQYEEVTPRANISRTQCCFTLPPIDHKVSGVDWLLGNQSRVKPIHLHVGYLSLSHSPQDPLTHP
jgi:hypothetical protein